MSGKTVKEIVKEQYSSLVKDEGLKEKAKKKGKSEYTKAIGYKDDELKEIPMDAVEYAFGCGNPLSYAQVKEGDIVLDLGSGAGIDVLLASKKVGRKGKVIGIDMTQEMIEKARANAERLGADNIEFCQGEIENIPRENESVDWIISNCVINLSPDKKKVFSEAFRVLKPGGKMLISDIVTEDLPEEIKNSLMAWVGCVAGAMREKDYLDTIKKAGFKNVRVVGKFTFEADAVKGMMEDCSTGIPDSLNEIYNKYKDEINGKVASIKVFAEKPIG
ncbi:MAG: hypothetical protein A2042_01725 [Candidatus Schekmanbacteria bacterium GWA2_38_11]|uniref:Arsenite methyltransferase n=1 Tax=Candidatus Schekmanbacteria bacterium GWA2_38_11 TaxID=1817876 RepID=A0A1F7RCZ7_9BACT|nr:MAG: hypothetical protein A2042_01725 [Candidatus Schekmanbacteria bacterium GWA2_38_11]